MTWAVYEICQDLKELHELEKAFDPFAYFKPEEEKVCGLPVPTESQIREMVLERPQLAWNQAREFLPNIQSSVSFDSKISEFDYKSMMDTFSLNLNFEGVKKNISDKSEKVIESFKGLYKN